MEGWRNHLIPPDEIKDIIKIVSEERLKICHECPFDLVNAIKANTYTSIRVDRHCSKCGCPEISKSKCLSCSCPEQKWDKVMNDEDEDKLLKKINKNEQ